ncbi:MAG: hypothetical protein RR311_07400 [Comamonas sp.]
MHFAPKTTTFPAVRPLLLCGLIASLYACGGSGGSDDSSGAGGGGGGVVAEPAITLSGAVFIDQALHNASVCVDLNTNAACDAAEPVAAVTGADGKYSLTYQPADAAAAAAFNQAPVIARVTPESADAAAPGSSATTKAFQLSAPAGKAAQITPLTTLVQAGIAGGMTREAAEAAVARQLGFSVAKLYDYQGDPASSSAVLPDTARTAAKVTAYALELGTPLKVVAPGTAAVATHQLGLLNFSGVDNYVLRERKSDGVLQADGYARQIETRAGKTGGLATAAEALFPSVTLTSNGWTRCDTAVPRLTTLGTPNRLLACNQSTAFLNFPFKTLDIGGKSMAEAVTALRAGDATLDAQAIRHDRSIEMDPSVLGTATFPVGAQANTVVSVQLNRSPAFINNTAADRFGFPTLDIMIANRPASAVNLATPATVRATTVGGAGLVDASHILRLAFVDAANAQFYSCESTAPAYTDLGTCVAHSQSAFSISTVNGVRLLNFANFPGKAFAQGATRGYTEYDGNVFVFREPAAIADEGQAVTYSVRLNGTAWNAMKSALGIN